MNFDSLVVACKDDNPCTVVVNVDTDGSAAGASVNAAAAVVLADTSVEKDAHVAAAP